MKNNKILVSGLLALTCCGALVGCHDEEPKPTTDTITVTDTLGRKVEVKKDIKNVYCAGAGSLRLYSYVSDLNKLCGVEGVEKGNPASPINQGAMVRPYQIANQDKIQTIKVVGKGGPSAQKFNDELLTGAGADVIFSMIRGTKEDIDEHQKKIGTPIIVLNYGGEDLMSEDNKSIINSLKVIGNVMGGDTNKKANELIDYMKVLKNELNGFTNTIKEENKPSVYIGGLAFWGQQAFYSSDTNYSPFELAGVKNFLKDKTPEQIGKVSNVNREIIYNTKDPKSTEGPDKIILDCGGMKLVANQFAQNTPDAELIKAIPAVKKGEVYLQPTYRDYYTNIELGFVNAFHAVKTVYPEQTKDLDVEKKTREILTKFTGKDVYDNVVGKMYGNPFQKIDNLEDWCKNTFKDKFTK